MVGRIRDSKGINYPFKIVQSELTPKLHLNIDFDSLIDKYDIIVLNHQPGIGKTYSIMNYVVRKLKDDSNYSFFYFTDKHKTIKEHISNFFKDYEVLHWEGFNRIISNRDAVSAYYNYSLKIPAVNKLYRINPNELDIYYSQFNKSNKLKRVFSPFNYLDSKYFTNKLEYLDIVFLDESITQMVTYSIDNDNTEKVFRALSSKGDIWVKHLHNNLEYFDDEILKEINNSYKSIAEDALQKKDDNKELLSTLKKFKPYIFNRFIKWGSLYDWKEQSYTFPMYYYNAFDAILKGVPIVISDASFNEYLFSYFLESYNGETRELGKEGFKDLNVIILQTKHKNKDTIIYRMHPRASYSKSSVVDYHKETEKSTAYEIGEIIRVFGVENVGIVSFKDISITGKLLGLNIEHFGGLRGTNILEDKPVLIILGTWLPHPPIWDKKRKESINNMVWEYFLIKLNKDDIQEAFATAPQIVYDDFGDVDIAKAHITIDKNFVKSDSLADIAEKHPASMINMHFFSEVYQAYHRTRGLRNNRIIFAYGWFPEPEMLINKVIVKSFFRYNLRNEFDVKKEFKPEKLYEILEQSEDIFLSWKKLILDIDNGKKSNTDIANEYKIWGGSAQGPNTGLIKDMREKIHNKFKKEIKDKNK
jgi:hypothetical protein